MSNEYRCYRSDELAHHGIKGQKWGVRRFRDVDGSLTAAGKKRYSTAGKVAAGVAVGAAAIGLGAYALKHPRYVSLNGSSTASVAQDAITAFLKKTGKAAFTGVSNSAKRAGSAMTDAAMMSVGSIAVAKLAAKYSANEGDSESAKNMKKIIVDTGTAGINAAVKANTKNSNNNNKGQGPAKNKSIGKDVTDRLGPPSHKTIDKNSSAWQDLFKKSDGTSLDADMRATIKSLASAGYDINQISEYLKNSK